MSVFPPLPPDVFLTNHDNMPYSRTKSIGLFNNITDAGSLSWFTGMLHGKYLSFTLACHAGTSQNVCQVKRLMGIKPSIITFMLDEVKCLQRAAAVNAIKSMQSRPC